MAKSIRDLPRKRRGRPSTGGRRQGILVRFESDQFDALDSWIAKQKGPQTRPEAIRRLVELGLTIKVKAKQPSAARANRAKELAAKTIEKIIDPTAPLEEKAERRRRLIKGPSEFREDRIDLPKSKR